MLEICFPLELKKTEEKKTGRRTVRKKSSDNQKTLNKQTDRLTILTDEESKLMLVSKVSHSETETLKAGNYP